VPFFLRRNSELRTRNAKMGSDRRVRNAEVLRKPFMRIDLNADVGESYGPWQLGDDEAVIAVVTSVNIACGGHAGDPPVMRRTIRLAQASGAAVGAHPGFADMQGFGRREMRLSAAEIEDLVLAQVGALAACARAEGVALAHVKAHGALYTMAARDPAVAEPVATAVAAFDPSLAVTAPAGSCLAEAAAGRGLRVIREAFADRAYRADRSLVPRTEPAAVITDPALVAGRALAIVGGRLHAADGTPIDVPADTICIHGDTPGAAVLARVVRQALERAGVRVAAPSR
jgi:5-oxoprolinase (ATP-hydrolysing) subunit A